MRKKYRIEITKTAETDIEKIWGYISADDIKTASRFILKIESEIDKLFFFPERFQFIPESEFLGFHYRHLVIGKYRVLYRVHDKKVFILRVIHSARLLNSSMFES